MSGLILLVLLLSACQAAKAVPTASPAYAHKLVATFTPTQVPPAATTLPAEKLVPATPTFVSFMMQGGVTLGDGTSQLILYGQRTGESDETIHVVHAGTFEEVETQRGLQTALNGGGPFLFTLMENQPFKSDAGATALADMSMGMIDEPDTYLVAMWTSDISTTFPHNTTHFDEKSFTFQMEADDVELEGWLENGRIGLSQPNLPGDQQQEGFNFILFHHAEETFILGFSPYSESDILVMHNVVIMPPDLLEAKMNTLPTGQDHSYLVKGFTNGIVSLPLQNGFPIPVPILEVNMIIQQK